MGDAEAIAAALGLEPHPEGGRYRETWRGISKQGPDRGDGTAIYFMLRAGEESRWHRVDTTEIWHYYAGAPIQLTLKADGQPVEPLELGPDILGGARPQQIVPVGVWQRAESLGAWTLVGCTCAPAFEFAGFELLAPGESPPGL